MTRQKCTASLKKYSFCAVLAIVYAANLIMPSSKAALETLLCEIKGIIGLSSATWKSSKPGKIGALSFCNIIKILHNYKCNIAMVDLLVNKKGKTPTLNKWLKKIEANACYIVIVKKHVLFVETKKIKSKWKIYDQSGVQTKQNMKNLTKKGGHAGKHLQYVIQIL
jgi:hypothetical protein